jgi:hypothetical protein
MEFVSENAKLESKLSALSEVGLNGATDKSFFSVTLLTPAKKYQISNIFPWRHPYNESPLHPGLTVDQQPDLF